MPFDFLTDDHLAQYGQYKGDLTVQQLQDYFLLTPAQLQHIATLRFPHTKLGFAIQLCTVQFLGTFLTDPLNVPDSVVRTLAIQLGATTRLTNPTTLSEKERLGRSFSSTCDYPAPGDSSRPCSAHSSRRRSGWW